MSNSKKNFTKRILTLTLSLALIISACIMSVPFSVSAATVTATDSHVIYADDFEDETTASKWRWVARNDANNSQYTANIADGKYVFSNCNNSGSWLRGMRFIPDKNAINQRIDVTFTAVKGKKPYLWARARQRYGNDSGKLYGYILGFECETNGAVSLKLQKRVDNSTATIGTTSYKASTSPIAGGETFRMELLVQGSNPTLVSVSLYDANDLVVCHNTYVDNTTDLQQAGSAGIAAGSAATDKTVSIDSFTYTSTDNVTGKYYVEDVVGKGSATFGQVVNLDPSKKYILAAHAVDAVDGNGKELVNPLWVEYQPGGSAYRELIDRKVLSSNRTEETSTAAGIEYSEYHTVFYTEIDFSDNGNLTVVSGIGDKIRAIVGFRNDNSDATKGKFSHFTLYAADDANKTNLLINPDFKMGLYGWSDIASKGGTGNYSNYPQMKEGDAVGIEGYANLVSANDYEYYEVFKNKNCTITQGDATGDSEIDVRDLVLTKKIAVNVVAEYNVAVDYDTNGAIAAADLACLRKQIMGISLDAETQVNVNAVQVLNAKNSAANVSLGGNYTADYK